MKKLLTILLVLLVAGFVFAGEPRTADLTLKSTVPSETKHGFFKNGHVSFAAILGEENDDNSLVGDDSVPVDMYSNTDNINDGIAHYSYASNAPVSVKVTVSADPMKLSGSEFTVPYTLTFTNLSDEQDLVSYGTADEDDATLVDDSSFSSDVRWASYKIDVAFEYANNEDSKLPSGDYSANVTAKITAN